MKMKLGCDPEIFLVDTAQNFRSVIDKFGGTKHHPRPLDSLGDGFFVQEDNVALEFNIPPADNAEVFTQSLTKIVDYLANEASVNYGYLFSNASAALFPMEELMDVRALEFGCEPDYNAWTGKRNPRPMADDPTLRAAGGHVHVGLDTTLSKDDKRRLGRLMDLHLGVPSVIMDAAGGKRKEQYGKGGAMRFKPYGMEYRTLSNFWVFRASLNQWVWDATERAVQDLQMGRDLLDMEEVITSTINSNNPRMASALVTDYGLHVVV